MTESEARSKIKYRLGIARQIAGNGVDGKAFEEFEIAIQALKEIREYRELGTVEDIQLIFSLCKDLERIVKKYEAIGTVEEFKDLKEKNGWHDMEMYGLGYNQGTIDRADELQKCREQGYNKAIDEFAKCLKERWIETDDLNLSSEFFKFVDKVSEQMKGGATDERTGSD